MKNSYISLFDIENYTEDSTKNVNEKCILNKDKFVEILSKIENFDENKLIKIEIEQIKNIINNPKTDNLGIMNIDMGADTVILQRETLLEELEQIQSSLTAERAKYYITRLIKSITEIKTNKINDLNLNRWKEYDDIILDSLWLFDKRDNSGAHNANYWGNFIPQIPNQFMKRYTKQGDWVLDTFLGSGTTLIECKRLGRNGIGIDLSSEAIELAKKNVSREENLFNIKTEILKGDSKTFNFKEKLNELGVNAVQLVIMHPPYWDIIKFSKCEDDLSNAGDVHAFLNSFGQVIDNIYDILESERYLVVVIGDKYSKGEWIPLGFYTMNEVLKRGFMLKSIIVKNFDQTKGKRNQSELWKFRALAGGFYIFKHEYIFLFNKSK